MWRYRNAAHYLAGMVSGMGVLVHWSMLLGGIALFIAYEVNEDWHLSDQAFRDILEFMLGFFTACVGLIIWEVFL